MNKAKRIGIDARFYGEAGPGRYIKNVLRELAKLCDSAAGSNEFLVFLRPKGMEQYFPINPNFKKITANYKWYSFDEQIRFLYLIYKSKIDLLYVPHFNIPILYFGKLVTAIPDLIMHYYSTEEATTLPKIYFKFKKLVYYFVVLWAVIRSSRVIVPSNDVRSDFLKVYPFVNKSKYVVAYEGVDTDFTSVMLNPEEVLQKHNITKPYLLYIGSMYTHKNLKNLVLVFKKLLDSGVFLGQLVLVGNNDAFSKLIFNFIKIQNLDQSVIMPGLQRYVTDAELVALRKEALLYVFPSLKEGFSLTPLEAQALGLPCVISDISCHREIYKNSVMYFDPKDVNDIQQALKTAVLLPEMAREKLVKDGLANSANYDWKNVGLTTLKELV